MISYLILSALSMGCLLLFYHIVLEHEKIHNFKRGFLIFALIFSLVIPVLPVGLFQLPLPWADSESTGSNEAIPTPIATEFQFQDDRIPGHEATSDMALPVSDLLIVAVFLIYLIITGLLFIRFLRIVNSIQLKAKRHRIIPYRGTAVVLHEEQVVPYTFLKTIYVNRDQYRNGNITSEVLRHELAHARQLHSLDVLFVEMLKTVLWFNPVLYLYKKAILLNHEFLADQSVLFGGEGVASYQRLIFNSLRLHPPHGLSSNFSYSITKKRFAMMTKTCSPFRSALKMMLPVPFFLLLALVFGCESTSPGISDEASPQGEATLEITEDNFIIMNGTEYEYDEFEEYFSTLPEPPELVHFEVSPEASMGMVTDVQMVLRKKGALRITYSSARSDSVSAGEYDKLTNEFMDAANTYMELPPADFGELDYAYKGVMQAFDSLKSTLQQVPDAPPPPPIPPSPEKRITSDINEAKELESPEPPPVRTRNLMRIKIGADGTVFMNNESTPDNEIVSSIMTFLENPDNNPDLSVSPKEAVIGIISAKDAPHNRYMETIDQIMEVYQQLREKAAQTTLGTSYAALSDGSPQKQEIDSAYPIRISIAYPE